jgi:hypothetical protein
MDLLLVKVFIFATIKMRPYLLLKKYLMASLVRLKIYLLKSFLRVKR